MAKAGKGREPPREEFNIVPTPEQQRTRAARLAMFGVMLKEALDG